MPLLLPETLDCLSKLPTAYEKERQVAIAAVLQASRVAQEVFKSLVTEETITKLDKSPVTGLFMLPYTSSYSGLDVRPARTVLPPALTPQPAASERRKHPLTRFLLLLSSLIVAVSWRLHGSSAREPIDLSPFPQ